MAAETLTIMIVSAALFILLWVILGKLLFKPYLEVLLEREARTTGAEKRAQERRDERLQLEAQIEQELTKARIEGLTIRDSLIAEARGQAQKILDEAGNKAQAKIDAGRKEISDLRLRAEREIGQEADKLSALVLERIVGREARPVVH